MPEHAFSWWIVAKKVDRPPDNDHVSALIDEAFRLAWPERISRTLTIVGARVTLEDGKWLRSQGVPGAVMYGPYMPLPEGAYTAIFEVRLLERVADLAAPLVLLDVISGQGDGRASRTLSAGEFLHETMEVRLDFELTDTTFGLQFRAIALNNSLFECRPGVSLQSHRDGRYSATALATMTVP